LSKEEQNVLSKLSVFRGGFTSEAAREVAGASLIMLARLVDKSLLRVADGRYDQHLLLQSFTREKLTTTGEENETRVNHARYFLAVAEEAKSHLNAANQSVFFKRLELDFNNLRAAFEWLLNKEETWLEALRLFNALGRFFMSYGYVREGRDWVDDALARASKASSPELANVLHFAGTFARLQGSYRQARDFYEQSRDMWQILKDKDNEAHVLGNLAIVLIEEGHYALAQQTYELIVEHFRASKNNSGIIAALHNLGTLHHQQGYFDKAHALYQECLGLCHELGNKRITAACLTNLGAVAYDQGDNDTAMQYCQESLQLMRDVGQTENLAETLAITAKIALELSDFTKARSYLRESLELGKDMDDKPGIITALEVFASLALAEENAEKAVCLWGSAAKVKEMMNIPLPPRLKERYERSTTKARKMLGEAAFNAAWLKGSLVTLEQAITLALEATSKNS
jgi:tetratricopeptide (TPR) repeat protein